MADNKSSGLLGGLVIGSALGAIAGLLAAPRTGRETRRILKKSADALPELAEDLATSVQFQADRLSDTSLRNWEGTLGRLREAIAAGRAATGEEWRRQADGTSSASTVAVNHEPLERAHEPLSNGSLKNGSAQNGSAHNGSLKNGNGNAADQQGRL